MSNGLWSPDNLLHGVGGQMEHETNLWDQSRVLITEVALEKTEVCSQ